MIVEKFPAGYDDRNINTFRNAKNKLIEAVEIMTDDDKYLIKFSVRLEKVMEDYDEDDYEDFDNDDPAAVQHPFEDQFVDK